MEVKKITENSLHSDSDPHRTNPLQLNYRFDRPREIREYPDHISNIRTFSGFGFSNPKIPKIKNNIKKPLTVKQTLDLPLKILEG